MAVAAVHPTHAALHVGDATLTFAALVDRVATVAAVVGERTQPGDRVALIAWNGPWWVDACFGVPMAGRLFTMVSPRLTVGEITSMLDVVDASLVIVDPGVVGGDLSVLAGRRRRVIGLDDWCRRTTATSAPTAGSIASERIDARTPAWLVFTSGTTSAPKAAALSHAGLLAAVDATAAVRPSPPDDVYLFPFPMWHVAMYNVLCRLVAGRPVVLHARFDPEKLVGDVRRHGVTSMSLAATMLDSLLAVVDADPGNLAALQTLRDISYGAAPMPSTVLRRAAELLDVRFWQGYGMTELSGNAVFLSADDHVRGLRDDPLLLRSAGRPAPGVELRIVDELDASVDPGVAGEIQVRAEQTMIGYWGDEAATRAVFTEDGWLRAGDIGTLDDAGLLFVLDRKKDVIITGGENVSAREVEEVLREHPDVADVAVVGVPDEHWGENVCAVVVPAAEEVDGDALRRHARAHLAGFKVPRHIVRRSSLPVNASGKVVKAELRAWLADHPDELGERW